MNFTSDVSQPAAKPSVLVVDDQAPPRQTLLNILTREGFDTRSAVSIPAALDTLAAAPVDIVLSDLDLPGRPNGIDLAHWTLHHRPQTKLILMAATVPLVPASSAISVVMPVLIKPLDEIVLLERLEAVSAFFGAVGQA